MTKYIESCALLGNFLLSFLFSLLVLFSPLIYGSLTATPLFWVQTLSFSVFFVFIINSCLEAEISIVKSHIIWLLFFILFVLFQIMPVPSGLLSLLSPSTFKLYREYGLSAQFYPLSIYPDLTVKLMLQLLSYLAIFFVAINYFQTPGRIKRMFLIIIFTGFIFSFYGIIHRLISDAPFPGFSTFTNRNHFAAYLEMIIPLGMVYSLLEESWPVRTIFIFFTSVMILALLMTTSRAGIACFFIASLVMFSIFNFKIPGKKIIAISVVLILVVSAFLGIIGTASITERLITLSSPFQAYSGRLIFIKDGFKITKDFFLFGTGFGCFGEIYQMYKSFKYHYVVKANFAHNEALQIFVETGLVGFLLIFLFLLRYFISLFVSWKKRKDRKVIYMSLGIFIGLSAVIMHSFFDFIFFVPANTFLFFILLAAAYRQVNLRQQQQMPAVPEYSFRFSAYIKAGVICICLIGLIFIESIILKRYRAEQIYSQIGDNTKSEIGIEAILVYKKKLKLLDQAIFLNPLNSQYVSKKADLISEAALRPDLREELKGLGPSSGAEYLILAEGLYKKAISLNPTNAYNHLRMGWLYSFVQKQDLAKEEFKKAVSLDPKNDAIKSVIEKYEVQVN